MSENTTPNAPRNERESRTAGRLRAIGAIVLFLLVFVGMIEMYSRTGRIEQSSYLFLNEITRFALYLAGGLSLGGLLVGIAGLLRILRDLHNSFSRMERFQYEHNEPLTATSEADRPARSASAAKADGDGDSTLLLAQWREMLALMADLRDNSLLSESERVAKKVRVANEDIESASTRIHAFVAESNFAQARELADQVARKHSDDGRATSLAALVERARERQESVDVRGTTRQVEDLMSISAWGRARELAQQLQQRHPDSTEARQLLVRIEREHRVFDDEQKRRMSAEVQRFVTRRRWEEAHAVAMAFIERFPGSEESEALRMQLPTLKANAEIETRQRLEAAFMDLVRHGRYIEALDLARRVIDQYPDSPQAEVLRSQLDRLEELAENPTAAPARVRLD